jgi:hypothetical protein
MDRIQKVFHIHPVSHPWINRIVPAPTKVLARSYQLLAIRPLFFSSASVDNRFVPQQPQEMNHPFMQKGTMIR